MICGSEKSKYARSSSGWGASGIVHLTKNEQNLVFCNMSKHILHAEIMSEGSVNTRDIGIRMN